MTTRTISNNDTMLPTADRYASISDDALFSEILTKRAHGENVQGMLGELCERWRKSAMFIIRRVQSSYKAGVSEDQPELFQEALRKLIERGLDQYRTPDEAPDKSASPKTFFLRIVKHVAIDFYRKHREILASHQPHEDAETAREEMPGEISMATYQAHRTEQRTDAQELYWAAFTQLQSEHPKEAEAWDLYHHQDLEDHVECAKALSITVANSYKRVSRAQAYLKKYVLELLDQKGAYP